ncbi:cytidine deaminase [uncultured Dialister sp.]|jgi:cytidine deaminase|uniref:cytidine deaminase n=1 Tax=uncultured Dialister sp. TaxID=278064 RepID=UPI0025E4EDA9|nr:cytidine deaminase [uncultured Dialister sp.]
MDSKDIRPLLVKALEVRKNSYSPYSLYPVGAALLAEDGSIYTGCNMENVSYPASLCAERNALGSAIADGKRKFRAIAIVGSPEDYTMPCGICRQVLAEFHVPLILCGKSEDDYRTYTLEEIFPAAFTANELKKK